MSSAAVTILVAIIGSGILNTVLSYFLTAKTKRQTDIDAIRKAQRLLMKQELRKLCSHYIAQEWIYEDELADIIAMHSCYHDDLKGNGFLDIEMARVKSLEIRIDGGVK